MFGWIKKKTNGRRKAPKMSRESLAALTRGIHHAASSTFSMLSQQYIQMLGQFFEQKKDPDGNLKLFARMAYVKISDTTETAVPLISLVAPKGLALERMKVCMSVRIEDMESKRVTFDEDATDIDRLSFKVSVSPRTKIGQRRASDVTDIEMEFSAGDPPEGVMRMIEAYTNLIEPKNVGKDNKVKEDHETFMKRYPPTDLSYTGQPKGERPGTEETGSKK